MSVRCPSEEGRRKTEKNSYLCTRHLRVLLLGIGNWQLGTGNWELLIFLRAFAISFHRLPITDYRLPITKFILANRRLSLADKIVNEAAVLLQSFRYPISVITVGEDMNHRFARIGQD